MNKIENKLIEIFSHIADYNKLFISELQTRHSSDVARKGLL